MKTLKASALNIRLENIELDIGLTIESFEVVGGEAAADLKPFQLFLKEPGRVRVVVTEQAVGKFLEKESPGGLRGFQVSIRDGVIHVSAKAQVIVSIPVRAVCTLEIEQQSRLMVRLQSVDVLGGGPQGMVEQQLAKINPILDAADFPVAVKLLSAELDRGQIVLHGLIEGI